MIQSAGASEEDDLNKQWVALVEKFQVIEERDQTRKLPYVYGEACNFWMEYMEENLYDDRYKGKR